MLLDYFGAFWEFESARVAQGSPSIGLRGIKDGKSTGFGGKSVSRVGRMAPIASKSEAPTQIYLIQPPTASKIVGICGKTRCSSVRVSSGARIAAFSGRATTLSSVIRSRGALCATVSGSISRTLWAPADVCGAVGVCLVGSVSVSTACPSIVSVSRTKPVDDPRVVAAIVIDSL